MPTPQDMHIWMTGVVGRSMGSGQFKAEDIRALTLEAHQVFLEVFGDPFAADLAAKHAELSARAKEAPAPAAPNGAPTPIMPGEVDGKPFQLWRNDKIRLGKKIGPGGKPWGEVTWAEAHRAVGGGSAQARGYLSFLANLEDKDPQYARSNAIMRGRAQSILDSVPDQEREQTPF
jgi:hypothetical protein